VVPAEVIGRRFVVDLRGTAQLEPTQLDRIEEAVARIDDTVRSPRLFLLELTRSLRALLRFGAGSKVSTLLVHTLADSLYIETRCEPDATAIDVRFVINAYPSRWVRHYL